MRTSPRSWTTYLIVAGLVALLAVVAISVVGGMISEAYAASGDAIGAGQ